MLHLFPPAGCLVPRLSSFSNEYLCLLPPLAPSILSSHLTLLDRLEDNSSLLAESIMLSLVPLLNSPLQVTFSITFSLKLAILDFCDGPQSWLLIPLLGNLVSFYLVSSSVFSLITSFLWSWFFLFIKSHSSGCLQTAPYRFPMPH